MLTANKTFLWVFSLIFILSGFHAFCIWYFSINAGWWDDYIVAFYEIERYINSESLNEKFKILVGPFGDHRSMLSRVFFLIQIMMNQYFVNYRYLMLIGNVFSFLSLFLFYKAWKIEKWDFLFFIPIVMFLLNLQFYEAQFFANGVFGYIAIVFFSIFLVWETAYKGRIWLMMLLGTIALLTFGNALFALVAVLVQLIFQQNIKRVVIWISYCGVACLLYFTEIENPNYSGAHFQNIDILKGFKAFIYHLGSPLNFNSSVESKMCLALGLSQIVLLSYFLITMGLKFINKTPVSTIDTFQLGLCVFGLLSVVAISFLRSNLGFDIMFLSRYRLAPTILLIVSYLTLIRVQKKWINVSVVAASTFCFYLPTQMIFFNKTKNFYVQKEAENWILKNKKGMPTSFNNPFDLSRDKNVFFKPDDNDISPLRSIDLSKLKQINECSGLEISPTSFGYKIVMQTTRKLNRFSKKDGLLLFFKGVNDADDFLIATDNDYHPKIFLKELIKKHQSLLIHVMKDYFPKGKYEIYIIEKKRGVLNAFQTNQNVIL
jgi:hypothetical protein